MRILRQFGLLSVLFGAAAPLGLLFLGVTLNIKGIKNHEEILNSAPNNYASNSLMVLYPGERTANDNNETNHNTFFPGRYFFPPDSIEALNPPS